MEYTVSDWMNTLIVYIDPDATVFDALSLMRRRYLHSLLVRKTDNSPEYGIITTTDISDKIIASGRNPSKVKIREIMNSPLITVPAGLSLKECSATMRKYNIHHLPVSDDEGEIIGLISAEDFLVVAEAMGREPGDYLS